MPYTETHSSLRQLVCAFTDGQIDRQTYRQRRARLLDELAANSISRPSQDRCASNPQAASAPEKPSLVLILIVVIISLLIIVLGYQLLMSPKDQPGKKENILPQQEEHTISEAIHSRTVLSTLSPKGALNR